MSTEHQKYSTQNQMSAIAQYASKRGLAVVRTYADEGQSGLRFETRHGLVQLIDDVEKGRADFDVVLVYDVSRWGRFQDVDESAFLEYICRRAGVAVHYCAEQFENDGSLSATIIKSMKRAMAGEYSRELSTKVFAGQCRLSSLGFRQGGRAGFGLRRQLLDDEGKPKGVLRQGERKSLQSDRVILVPGPRAEVRTVRRIYRLFVERRLNESAIAALLNREGVKADGGRRWTRAKVNHLLRGEKYVGNHVYNRVSTKLKKKKIQNPPTLLVRADHAFEPIVDLNLFTAAREILRTRRPRYSNAEMLSQLEALFHSKGRLSQALIRAEEHMAPSGLYQRRFGSLQKAYRLVGCLPSKDVSYIETKRYLRNLQAELISEAINAIEHAGGSVEQEPLTRLLVINCELTVSLVVVGCYLTKLGTPRWSVRRDSASPPDIAVAVRMNPGNRIVRDYYLFPRLEFDQQRITDGRAERLLSRCIPIQHPIAVFRSSRAHRRKEAA